MARRSLRDLVAVAPSRPPDRTAPLCGACGLHKKCKSPQMPVSGGGRLLVLVVAEAPGEEEDARGTQLVGRTGTYLADTLRMLGVDLYKDCWLHNALACRPPANREPDEKEIGWCRPNLINAVRDLKPEVIIPLGSAAVSSVLGWLWKDSPGGVLRWAGFRIPVRGINTWVCPTYHPSYVVRQVKTRPGETIIPLPEHRTVTELLWREHLRAAFDLAGTRPYDEAPGEDRDGVRVLLDDREVARVVRRRFLTSKSPVAFDYETNMLKPDSRRARIHTCSLSDGEVTVAFPWQGRAVAAVGEFLFSRVPKVASNAKFEERWTLKEFGRPVVNWLEGLDTALAAHVLDNRPDIAGIKFQAFARLGVAEWDSRVRKYLKAGGSNDVNRIGECRLHDLLVYNGLDSLYEWQVAKQQAAELGIEWPES